MHNELDDRETVLIHGTSLPSVTFTCVLIVLLMVVPGCDGGSSVSVGDGGVSSEAGADAGAADAVAPDLGQPRDGGSPPDVDPCAGAEEGAPCSEPGKTCGSCSDDPCQWCNLLRCDPSIGWTRLEAYPDPRCSCGNLGQCPTGHYCLMTGCGVPDCEPPEPGCEPMPAGCVDCSCPDLPVGCICEQVGSATLLDCPAP